MKLSKFYLLIILAMITWGIAWTNAKIVSEYIDVELIIFFRFIFSTLTFIPILLIMRIPIYNNSLPKRSIIICSILFLLYNYCFFKGTNIGYAGLGGVFVTTTNPIITYLLESIYFRSRMNKKEILGISLGFIGGVTIIRIWDLSIENIFLSGNIYFIGCSIIWSIMTIIMSRSQKNISSILFIFWCYAITSILILPIITPTEIYLIFSMDLRFWINFMMVSFVAMTFGTSIYIYSTSKLGSKKSSAFIFLIPVIALSTSVLILNEPITLSLVLGGFTTIIAVYILNYNR